jgi:hypothetical protein
MKFEWTDEFGVHWRFLAGDEAARIAFGDSFIEMFAECLAEDGYDGRLGSLLENLSPPVNEKK